MKNILVYTLTVLSIFLLSFTKRGYETAMNSTIADMYKASGIAELQSIANKFDRIGSAEKDKWLPSYYSAYCHVMMSATDSVLANRDRYLDKADASLENAGKNKKVDMVEVLVLKGFSSMMRITVDPGSRGQEYSMKSAGFLQQANQLNDQNPRVLLMMAQMLYGTAQFFGSGTAEACQQFTDSKALFDIEEAEGRGILPTWGKPQVESMLKQCANSTKDN